MVLKMSPNVLSCLHVPHPTLILEGRQCVLKQRWHCNSVPTTSSLHICSIHGVFWAHDCGSSFSMKILCYIMHLLCCFPVISLWLHVSLLHRLLLLLLMIMLLLLLLPVNSRILLYSSGTCHRFWRLSRHTAWPIHIDLLHLFYCSRNLCRFAWNLHRRLW